MKFAFALLLGSQLFGASFVIFQAPNCPGTAPTAINNDGVIVGTCSSDQGAIDRGFIRGRSGRFTALPGLVPAHINIRGAITGTYQGTCEIPLPNVPPIPCSQGFVRSSSGAVTKFSANKSNGTGTFPSAINSAGRIVGVVTSGSVAAQGFLRNPDGTIVTPLEAISPPFYKGALPADINDSGEVVGAVIRPVTDILNSFLLAPDGTATLIGPLNIASSAALGINNTGTVVGYARMPSPFPFTFEGYIQARTGAVIVFPLPKPVNEFGTRPPVGARINNSGVAVIQNVYYDGTATTIDLGPCTNVVAAALNDSGWVTGTCTVQGGKLAGFLWRK